MTGSDTSGDPHTRRGTVTREDDGRQRLEFRRSWPDPIEDVWAALTEPDRLARWIGRYDGARGPGGTGTFFMTHEEGEHTGSPATIRGVRSAAAAGDRVGAAGARTTGSVALDLWTEDGPDVC